MLVDPTVWQLVLNSILTHGPTMYLYFGVFFIIYTSFFSYFRSSKQKKYIFFIVILTNVFSIWMVLQQTLQGNFNIVSSFFIILNGLILLSTIILWMSGELDMSIIPNRSAPFENTIYGTFIVIVLVLSGKYFVGLSSTNLFSMSVAYAILFNKNVLSHVPAIYSSRTKNIDLIEKIVTDSVAEFKKIKNPLKREIFCIITNESTSRIEDIPRQYFDNYEAFYNRELAKEDRTNRYVAVATLGYIVIKDFFKGKREVFVTIIDVYPNKHKQGYEFYYREKDKDVSEDQIIYKDRIPNAFMGYIEKKSKRFSWEEFLS